MRVLVLTEDSSSRDGFEAEHGLSLYVEDGTRKFMIDVGASGLFARNAQRFGVAVSEVDSLFLSHGHRDHVGGLPTFLELNRRATIYSTESAFEPHFSLRKNGRFENIGFPELSQSALAGRLVFNPGVLKVDGCLTLFSQVEIRELRSEANDTLFTLKDPASDALTEDAACYSPELFSRDAFAHEQNLTAITETGKKVLFVGCAHCGVVNIVNRFIDIFGDAPDVVVGGFHLMIPSRGETVPSVVLDKIAERMAAWPTRFYTGHCTGRAAYERLYDVLGERVSFFGAGTSFDI